MQAMKTILRTISVFAILLLTGSMFCGVVSAKVLSYSELKDQMEKNDSEIKRLEAENKKLKEEFKAEEKEVKKETSKKSKCPNACKAKKAKTEKKLTDEEKAEKLENDKFTKEQEAQNKTFQKDYDKVRSSKDKKYDFVIITSNSANFEIENKAYEGSFTVKKIKANKDGKKAKVIVKSIHLKDSKGQKIDLTLKQLKSQYDAIKIIKKDKAPIDFKIDGSEGSNLEDFIENY